MNTLTRFLYLVFFLSCGNAPTQKIPVDLPRKDTIDIFSEIVYSIDDKKDRLDVKTIESILSRKYFTKVPFSVEFKEAPGNNLNVYSVKLLGNDLPTSLNSTYTFIDAGAQHSQYLLPIEYNQFYQVGERQMIGGIYSYREFDYYLIYELHADSLKRILDTRRIAGQAIKIGYYKDDECIDYVPDRMKFKYNNALSEIEFTGKATSFCNNGEDRTERNKVVKETALDVVIRFRTGTWEFDKATSSYFFW